MVFSVCFKNVEKKRLEGPVTHPSRDGHFSGTVVFYSKANFYTEAGEDSWMEIKSWIYCGFVYCSAFNADTVTIVFMTRKILRLSAYPSKAPFC